MLVKTKQMKDAIKFVAGAMGGPIWRREIYATHNRDTMQVLAMCQKNAMVMLNVPCREAIKYSRPLCLDPYDVREFIRQDNLADEVYVEFTDAGIVVKDRQHDIMITGWTHDIPPLYSPSVGGVKIGGNELKTLGKKVLFAVNDSPEQEFHRPILTGVHIVVEGGKLTAHGCDGYRLSTYTVAVDGLDKLDVVVPKIAVQWTAQLASENVRISSYKDIVFFDAPSFIVAAQTIEGIYPKIDSLLPKGEPNIMQIERKKLLDELKTADDEVSVGDVLFNKKYLLQALRAMDSPMIEMRVWGPASPVEFTGDSNFSHVLMPIVKYIDDAKYLGYKK